MADDAGAAGGPGGPGGPGKEFKKKKKLNIHLLRDPGVLLPGIYPREKKVYVHTKIVHKGS